MKLKSGNSHSITQVCDCDLQELDILPNCVPANDRSSSLHLSARASPCQRAKAISGYFSHLISAVTFSPEATKRPEHHTNLNVLAASFCKWCCLEFIWVRIEIKKRSVSSHATTSGLCKVSQNFWFGRMTMGVLVQHLPTLHSCMRDRHRH